MKNKNDRYRWHTLSGSLRKRKLRIVEKLGGCCVVCGETDIDLLEFHHPAGKNWRSRDCSRTQRLKRYEEDADAGLVELLCDSCHNDNSKHPDTCFCPFCRGVDF